MSDMPEIHGGAFAGISKALGDSKKSSTPEPKEAKKPEGFYSGASYNMAHAASTKAPESVEAPNL